MDITKNVDGDVTIIALNGRLDGEEATRFEQEVLSSVESGAAKLLFDFGGLDYINSSGLRVLVMAYQRLHPNGGKIAICSIKDYIQEIFDISGYNKLFALHPDQTAAMGSF